MAVLKTIRTELPPVVARAIRAWTAAHADLPANAAERKLFTNIDSVSRHVAMAGATMDLRLPVQADAVSLCNRFLSDLLAGAHWRARYERSGVHRILIDAGVYRPDPDAEEADVRRHGDAVIRYNGRLYAFHGWLPEASAEDGEAPSAAAAGG